MKQSFGFYEDKKINGEYAQTIGFIARFSRYDICFHFQLSGTYLVFKEEVLNNE
jgi:hypothetical protein